jgi:hypothetical protein
MTCFDYFIGFKLPPNVQKVLFKDMYIKLHCQQVVSTENMIDAPSESARAVWERIQEEVRTTLHSMNSRL